MENVDYIIVGDGYASLFFAHQLQKFHKSFRIFSEGKRSASQVSAGIINPVVLKKFTTFWKAQEQIDYLKNALSEIESYTGSNYFINENIHRIFHDEREWDLWLKKSANDDLKPFLLQDFESVEGVRNPFQTGVVLQSGRLNVNDFFSELLNYFENQGNLIKEKFDYARLKGETYKDYSFKNIIFCEGMGVLENPYFSFIPVQPNKGHHLTVKLSKPLSQKFTLKKKHFLFPLEDGNYYYGGTYDREQRHMKIDDSAKDQLIDGLAEFYPDDFEIGQIEFGFRPTVKDRRPILGKHPDISNYYVFNGLGARGILNGCYFSSELFEFIENGKSLHPEVDLKRFL